MPEGHYKSISKFYQILLLNLCIGLMISYFFSATFMTDSFSKHYMCWNIIKILFKLFKLKSGCSINDNITKLNTILQHCVYYLWIYLAKWFCNIYWSVNYDMQAWLYFCLRHIRVYSCISDFFSSVKWFYVLNHRCLKIMCLYNFVFLMKLCLFKLELALVA